MLYNLLRICIMLLVVIPFSYGIYKIFIQSNTLLRILIVFVYVIVIMGVLLSETVDILGP